MSNRDGSSLSPCVKSLTKVCLFNLRKHQSRGRQKTQGYIRLHPVCWADTSSTASIASDSKPDEVQCAKDAKASFITLTELLTRQLSKDSRLKQHGELHV